jgi:hypothetical protein
MSDTITIDFKLAVGTGPGWKRRSNALARADIGDSVHRWADLPKMEELFAVVKIRN